MAHYTGDKSLEAGNKLLANAHAAKLGAYGKHLLTRIEAAEALVNKLENTPPRSMSEFRSQDAQLTEAKQRLEGLMEEYRNPNVLEMRQYNDHLERKQQNQWAEYQKSFTDQNKADDFAVSEAVSRIQFNAAAFDLNEHGERNISDTTIKRNVGKLVNGQGEDDGQGGKFVRFQEGNGAIYRAVLNSEGNIGIVRESHNGQYDYSQHRDGTNPNKGSRSPMSGDTGNTGNGGE